MTVIKNLKKNHKIIIGIVTIIFISILLFILQNSKIESNDYFINNKGYIEVTVNKNINNMNNLKIILDDLSMNYTFKSCEINDDKYCVSMISNHNKFVVVGVYKNIGTAKTPKRSENIDEAKTKELNKYLEKYYK